MDISFLLPSNTKDRDPKDFVLKSIEAINNLKCLDRFEYEICVFSQDKIEGDNVRWLEEETFADGCATSYNELAKFAKGKYFIQSGDDYYFDENLSTAIDLLESDIYKDRQLKLLVLGTDNGLGSFMPRGYPKYAVCRYPIIARETIMQHMNGHMFHPSFKNHYADNWLGYWVTTCFDETIVEVWNTVIHIGPPTSYNTHNDHDFGVFRQLVEKRHQGYTGYV